MKILMEIDPLPMRGSLVMTLVMISPSWREVSPAEQLRQSPRLVPPRGGGVLSRKMAYDFFLVERLHIEKMAIGGPPGGPRGRGRAQGGRARPHPRGRWVAPSGTSFAQYFLYILK